MPFLELFDETLDINSTENYELSVQISPEHLYFCLLDSIRNKYILFRSTEPEDGKHFQQEILNDIIRKDDFLTRKYKKTNVLLTSPKLTLVPAPLFDPSRKDEYFGFNLNRNEDEVILFNRLNDPDALQVYSAKRFINDILAQFWPSAEIFHHSKPLLSIAARASKSITGNYIHVHLEKDFFNIIVSDKSGLRLTNTFRYRNVSDILYYVLGIYKTQKIVNTETIHLSGLISRFDDIWSGFAPYLKNLRLEEPSGSFTFSYIFNDLELHRHLNLFSAHNCG